MPINIQRRFPKEDITGSSGNVEVNPRETGEPSPSEFGSVGRAKANEIGALTSGIAGVTSEAAAIVAEAQRRQADQNKLIYINQSLSGFSTTWGKHINGQKSRTGTDANGITKESETFYTEAIKDYLKNAPDDEVRGILTGKFASVADPDIVALDMHERTERRNSVITSTNEYLNILSEDVLNEPAKLDQALRHRR